MRKISVGEKAVLLYLAATYLPQFLLHVVDEEDLADRFRVGTGTQWLASFALLFTLLVLLLQRWFPHVSLRSSIVARVVSRMFESRLNTVLGLVLIGLAINFAFTEGISFRQTGDTLGNAGIAVGALMFSKPYIYAWLVYHYLIAIRGETYRHGRARLQAALFLVALVVSLTGSLDVFPIVWTILFTVHSAPRLRQLFGAFAPERHALLRTLLVIFSIPLAAGLIVLIIAIGYINKTGIDAFADVVEQVGVERIFKDTVVRVSSSYASMISFADHNLSNFQLYEQVAAVPLENVPYRLSLIFGEPFPRPEITQIARINYLNYEHDTHLERAGASPGLVSSAFFAAPFPLGFFLIAIYTVAVIRIVNLPFSNLAVRPKIGAVVFCASFIYPLFETPVDYLVFIDPSFVQLLLVLGAFMAAAAVRIRRPSDSSIPDPQSLRITTQPSNQLSSPS